MVEDKYREKSINKPQGRCISRTKILHMMIKYPKVVTNINFCKISTMPLELQAGVRVDYYSDKTEDGAYVMDSIESFWSQIYYVEWRMHTKN